MSIFDNAIGRIDAGMQGLNKGLPMGFDRLVKHIPNIQRGTYYLIGAGTKVGKTSLTDDAFLYNPYDYIRANPDCGMTLDIDYFSYEIEKTTKIIKGVNRKLYYDYGIVTDVNYVLSRGKSKISQEIYDKVLECRKYFDEMEDMVNIFDMPENPTGINKYLMRKAEKHGKIIKKQIHSSDDAGNEKIFEVFDHYVPTNPNRFHLIIIDHIALAKEERGYTTKKNIDKLSQYMVGQRNNFGSTPVIIQQLSFDAESNTQRKLKGSPVPTLGDFGDSKYTTRDANVVLTLFNPSAHQLDSFGGYNIRRLGNHYRNLEILVNRDGEPNINIGLYFEGKVGTFRELSPVTEMTEAKYVALESHIKKVNSADVAYTQIHKA